MSKISKTYAEKNKGKLKEYRISRGRHTRYERMPAGNVDIVIYGAGMSILLTEEGAKSLQSSLGLRMIGDDAPVEVKPIVIEVPEDWEDLPGAKKIALASEILGEKVKTVAKAMDVIDAYLAKLAETSSENDKTSDGEENK